MSQVDQTLDAPFASRSRLLTGMAVVAALLGALVLWTLMRRAEVVEQPRLGEPLLSAFVPSAIQEINIRWRKNFRLMRKDGGWIIEDPTGLAPVPDDRVDDFLASLGGTVSVIAIGDAGTVNLAEFGLDPPQGEIVLASADRKELRILLGDRNPPLTGLYVEVMPGGNVTLVGAVLRLELEKLAALASAEPPEVRGASPEPKED